MDANGLPYKASKSNTTTYLQKRCNSVPVIVGTLPPSWIPDTAVLEGMFMIQTPPLPIMEQMQDYVKLLLTKYVKPHLVAGAKEVHIVFDNPGSLSETPKELEHVRRDKDNEAAHQCLSFKSSLPIPDKWRSILACRNCKKNLTQYIAAEMLDLCTSYLQPHQKFITNIGIPAFSRTSSDTKIPEPTLNTNADEADLRVWLHCVNSEGNRKLIFSPDNDVYHIGLTVSQTMPHTDVFVQLSKSPTDTAKFIHQNGLIQALASDPDLASVPTNEQAQALQTLYVCTGCDYISFFQGIGKVSFLQTFFQNAKFILGDPTLPGTIGHVTTIHDNPEVCLLDVHTLRPTHLRLNNAPLWPYLTQSREH